MQNLPTIRLNLDQAAVIVTALEQIFLSSAPASERRQAAVAYIRDELADARCQAAAREAAESFPPQSDLLAPPPADRLFGIAVRPQAVCCKCGDPIAIIAPGKPPHFAMLQCRSCDAYRGWLPRAHGAYLAEIIADAGVPREPITLHSVKLEKNDDGVSVVRSGMRKEMIHVRR
jgi:hypothetical protein